MAILEVYHTSYGVSSQLPCRRSLLGLGQLSGQPLHRPINLRILLANGLESSGISDLSRLFPTQKCGLGEFANSIPPFLALHTYPENDHFLRQ
jgi:hypothetical protein